MQNMEYRLFPSPEDQMVTPFTACNLDHAYARYVNNRNGVNLVTVLANKTGIRIQGYATEEIIGTSMPDREKILDFLSGSSAVNHYFIQYIQDYYVIPTFSQSIEEAFIRTVIRQVISAKQAKHVFSNFIHKFGYSKDGIFGFPDSYNLYSIKAQQLKEIGLGFKAERITEGIRLLNDIQSVEEIRAIKGIGDWSSAIMEVEIRRDYSKYPFWDLSCEKAKRLFGVDVEAISRKDQKLAGGIYLYVASFMEKRRQ